MARSRSVTGAVLTAFGLAFVACRLGGAFVGSSPQLRGGSQVARRVGVDYLLRNGPKDADPPLMDPNTASGATHEIEFKKCLVGMHSHRSLRMCRHQCDRPELDFAVCRSPRLACSVRCARVKPEFSTVHMSRPA